MADDMTSDRDDTNGVEGAATEPTARELLSVAFTDEHDQRLAVGGPDADAFGGSDASDHSWGLGGGDRLGGGAEDDVLSGGAGRDLLSGGEGNDTLYGGAMADALMGGPGRDYLDEGPGHSSMEGGPGDDTLVGGAGPDAFVVRPDSGHDVVRDFTAEPGVGDHVALFHLRWEELSVEDTDTGVRVAWDDGSVLLEGVRKADLSQDDFMFFNEPDLPPGARAPGGPVAERPSPSVLGPEIEGAVPPADQGRVPASDEGARAFSFDEFTVAIGTDAGEWLRGAETWDTIFGRGGNDTLVGEDGHDILEGGEGDDDLDGGEGPDRVEGNGGNDTLAGGEENDELMGGDGDDHLSEGDGHGMIEGGRGDDTLEGGAGSDAFMVDPDSGHDVVLDFTATGLAQGLFDHIAFMDIEAGDVTVQDTDRGARVAWDVDHNGVDDGSILLLGVAKDDLRQSDFMFDTPQFVEGINDFGSWYIFA